MFNSVLSGFAIITCFTSPAYAYPNMAGSCDGPGSHSGAGGTAATDTTGYSLSVESTSSSGIFDVTVTSTSTFKGFLVKAKEQSNDGAQILGFESLPAGSTYLNSCPDPNALVSRTAISHTNSNAKSSVTAQLNCGLYEGDVTVTAYLVTSYTSPYISLSKVFTCTSSGSATMDPSKVATTSTPGDGDDDDDDDHDDHDSAAIPAVSDTSKELILSIAAIGIAALMITALDIGMLLISMDVLNSIIGYIALYSPGEKNRETQGPAYAYPGMAGSCTGPQAHSGAGGTAATDTTGYSLSVESTSSSGIFDVTVTSTITFKGFLVKAKEQSNDGAQILGFESLPAGSTYLNSCPDPEALVSRTAISHTNSNAKSSVTAQLNCGLYEGAKMSLTLSSAALGILAIFL
ncbi:hypothetical protein FOL47_006755 [Perkinsus chesapeaki]|uniref:Reelin domain-containing protein n=1 Tax=Perkinsus chesapeaki TaxID=330153 RepID=A0A7J6LQB0_PERCH|nr:hypothetical protein FOL47_006755 [Perkinsus chesapeaki]